MGDAVEEKKDVKVVIGENDEKLELEKPMLRIVFNNDNELQISIQIMLEKKDLVWRQEVQTWGRTVSQSTLLWHVHIQEKIVVLQKFHSSAAIKLIVKQMWMH